MIYKVRFGKSAEKYLDKQTHQTRNRIKKAVHGLPNGDVKKLQGREGYRLVVGGFRILFDELDCGNIVIFDIKAIGSRGDVYKK